MAAITSSLGSYVCFFPNVKTIIISHPKCYSSKVLIHEISVDGLFVTEMLI